MQRTFNLSMLISIMLLLLGAQQAFSQDQDDKKAAKTIAKVGKWECKKLQKDGREINIKGIAGIVTMEFRIRKDMKTEKFTDAKGNEKKKKVKEVINVFKMEMGGNDRIFNYNVKNDSVQFVGVNGWNDYRIVRVEKDEMVLEHNLDNSIYRWTMIPSPKDKPKKK
ncbi:MULTISPECIES: lipocalin family protein [unclassified Aureispira]|uniref:lipocalin family protein n=1 Tax=unclassified Aureispira TaxID=2649989 RepID=UPI000695D3E1|nr:MULTISPECIES: lipocalin family protein [unclassified Aureispira]WMX16962.1 lipocalin family protein [Aureispira sp. CCB-E]